jgi:prepilin-type N-terminal cleavage/methylation domain-containing protein
MDASGYGAQRDDESGFGLVELVVAIAILALISLSLVPLLINGITQSASNTTIATATQYANQQIELSAAQPTSCQHFNDYGILSTQTQVDPRGVTLVITNTVAACPTAFPNSRVFTSTVTRQDTGATLITATTLVYVSGS